MLRVLNLEEIDTLLLDVPGLVDRLQAKDRTSADATADWLKRLEDVLGKNNLPEASKLASLRMELQSSRRGIIPPWVVIHGSPTGRKIKEATTSGAVRQAVEIVTGILSDDRSRISEAERVVHQLVALSKMKGLFDQPPDVANHTLRLKAVWQVLSNDPDLAPGVANAESLVGPNDVLLLLDRNLARHEV